MLLKITSPDTGKFAFIFWAAAPAIVTVFENGKAAVFCKGPHGLGPTFEASVFGVSDSHGTCVQMTIDDSDIPVVLDGTLRAMGELAVVDFNAELFDKCTAAWNAVAPASLEA